MANKRIFSGCYAVGIAADGSSTFTPIHGLQTVGINTSFNLEQAFEIGQINIYENIENVPDIEVTMEKIIDGYPPMYVLATKTGSSASLTGRGAVSCQVAMSIFGDTVDSNVTESLTLVGQHKIWKSASFDFTGTLFNNLDQPLALSSGLGGVQRRENVIFSDLNGTLLPAGDFGGIPGISSSGTNNKGADGQYGAHIQGITISANLGRTPLYELGRRNQFFRYLEFPIEVTTEISTLSTDGDLVSCDDVGVIPGSGSNLADKTIKVKLEEGLYIDTGTRNKLSSVSMSDAAATGGNMIATFSYSTFNFLRVTHPQDPASLS
jgi:hypothetical protein